MYKRYSQVGKTCSFVCSDRPPQETEDDQSILIETSSCNLQFFSELITTQLRDFHIVPQQVVFTLILTVRYLAPDKRGIICDEVQGEWKYWAGRREYEIYSEKQSVGGGGITKQTGR